MPAQPGVAGAKKYFTFTRNCHKCLQARLRESPFGLGLCEVQQFVAFFEPLCNFICCEASVATYCDAAALGAAEKVVRYQAHSPSADGVNRSGGGALCGMGILPMSFLARCALIASGRTRGRDADATRTHGRNARAMHAGQ